VRRDKEMQANAGMMKLQMALLAHENFACSHCCRAALLRSRTRSLRTSAYPSAAKGLLVYLLSRPPNWSVQHKQLQRALGIGRKLLTKLLNELAEAGYVDRDEYPR